MKRVTLLFLSLVAIISMQSLSAQNFSVKGKVISEEGNEPLIGTRGQREWRNYRY